MDVPGFQMLLPTLPFSVKDKLHLEVCVASGSNPLIYEHVHVFSCHHEDRTGEGQRAHHLKRTTMTRGYKSHVI